MREPGPTAKDSWGCLDNGFFTKPPSPSYTNINNALPPVISLRLMLFSYIKFNSSAKILFKKIFFYFLNLFLTLIY
jgi:hypothetical protein